MAVTINKESPLYYCSLFVKDQTLLNKALQAGITESFSGGALRVLGSEGKNYGAPVPIKAATLSLAMQGTLGPASGAIIKKQVTDALEWAVNEAYNNPNKPYPFDLQSYPKGPAIESFAELFKKKIQEHSAEEKSESFLKQLVTDNKVKVLAESYGAGPTTLAASLAAGDPVPLAQATKLYQRTNGTSTGSIYYVVILAQGLNVAMRKTGGKFTLRAEGLALNSTKQTLTQLGFNFKEGYASVHFHTGDPTAPTRTVGALVGMIGFDKVYGVADANKVPGAL